MHTQASGHDGAGGESWLDAVQFNSDGLVPVVAQDADSGVVLMVAWMNAEALARTAADRVATYYSRSRQRLWVKGESSGHRQDVVEMRLDCDADCVLLRVNQHGGIACHTGREHCFFRRLEGAAWQPVEAVLRDPAAIYARSGAS